MGPLMGNKRVVITAVIIFFISSLLIAYILIAQTTQRAYSIPSNKENRNNSTLGGEAFEREFPMLVHFGPRPGATNVSLDTLIYVDQMRPVAVDLQASPKISFNNIKEEQVGIASRITIYYPEEHLQPDTPYNVSGIIKWTFTTASSVIPKPEYEYVLSPYTWWVALIAS